MLDALFPAAEGLLQALKEGKEVSEAVRVAARAAEDGAKETQKMIARAGRSSYIDETLHSLTPDPGAHAVAIWFAAVSDALQKISGTGQ